MKNTGVFGRVIALLFLGVVLCMSILSVNAEAISEVVTVPSELSSLTDKYLPIKYRRKFQYKQIDGEKTTLNYRLYVPDDYDEDKAYPVIIFFHGIGERGTDNDSTLNFGMFYQFFTKGYYEDFECIIIVPQCPPEPQRWVFVNWSLHGYEIESFDNTCGTFMEPIQLSKKAIDLTSQEYNVDPDRIYVSGLSMGGYGTWNIMAHYPEIFAAGVPICGVGPTANANRLVDIPIWCFHGGADSTVSPEGSRQMYQAIVDAGGTDIHYTEWQGIGHAWLPAYADRSMWEWMFSQSKKTADTSVLAPYVEKLSKQKTPSHEEDAAKLAVDIEYVNSVYTSTNATPAMVESAIKVSERWLGDNNHKWMIVGAVVGAVLVAGAIVSIILGTKRRNKITKAENDK